MWLFKEPILCRIHLVAFLTVFDFIHRCSVPLTGCFGGEGETFLVGGAGGALVDEGFAEGQVLEVLDGDAVLVGDPAGGAEVAAVEIVEGLVALAGSQELMHCLAEEAGVDIYTGFDCCGDLFQLDVEVGVIDSAWRGVDCHIVECYGSGCMNMFMKRRILHSRHGLWLYGSTSLQCILSSFINLSVFFKT